MKRVFFFFGLLIGFIVLSQCSRVDERDYIRVGHTLEITHPVHLSLVHMSERLAEISSGNLSLKIYPNGQLGSEREMIELLQLGALDITKVSASPLGSFAPEMNLFSIPYLFRDNDHYWNVLNGKIGQDLLESLEHVRLRGVGYFDAGARSFYTSQKQVQTPSDLSGLKIRVMNSQMAMDTIDVLGGAATPMSWGELYTGLQQGVVDGAENNPPTYLSARHYEVARYYTLDEHSSIPDVILMSSVSWARLSDEERKWVQSAMDQATLFQRDLWKRAEQEALSQLEQRGVIVYRPDKSDFQAKVIDLHNQFNGTDLGKAILAVRDVQ